MTLVCTEPGPCLTTAIWRCHKNSSQWQHSFQWKLHSHWLKFLRQRHVAVVWQGPGHRVPVPPVRPLCIASRVYLNIKSGGFTVADCNWSSWKAARKAAEDSKCYILLQCLIKYRWPSTTASIDLWQNHSFISYCFFSLPYLTEIVNTVEWYIFT